MRVFATNEYRKPEQFMPTEAEFVDAVSGFREIAAVEVGKKRLVSAAIYGSVALALQSGPSPRYIFGETYGPWSDIDMSLTPVGLAPNDLAAIRAVKKRVNVSGHMDMGKPIQHTRERLASGNHEIDRFFGTHLTSADRIVIGEDPADYMQFPNTPADIIVSGYLRHKMQRMNDLIDPDTERDRLVGLQRALELPVAVGRIALNALDEVNGTNNSPADSANKRSIVPAAMNLYESLDLAELPQHLLDLSTRYKRSIMSALEGTIEEKEYMELLAEIQSTGIGAGTWLDKLDVALTRQLEQQKSTL